MLYTLMYRSCIVSAIKEISSATTEKQDRFNFFLGVGVGGDLHTSSEYVVVLYEVGRGRQTHS